MIERRAPFGTDELPTAETAADLATSLAMGRELEQVAAEGAVSAGPDFTTRVMAAIAVEPVPQPVVVAGRALRVGRPVAFAAAVRDAWRVAWTGGRPLAVRAQAMALVLVAIVGLGTVASIGGSAVAGALGLFDSRDSLVSPPVTPIPSPSVAPMPSPSPSPLATPTPTLSPSPTPSPSPSPTETASPDETDGPERTEDPTDDSSGPGGGGSGSGRGSGSSGSGSDAGG